MNHWTRHHVDESQIVLQNMKEDTVDDSSFITFQTRQNYGIYWIETKSVVSWNKGDWVGSSMKECSEPQY